MKQLNLFTLIISTFLITNLVAQIPTRTDGAAMKAIITEISSDAYKGRQTGSDEGLKTENYFAEQFKKLGLKPGGENGTYFHTFDYGDYKTKSSELIIDGRAFSSGFDQDYELMYLSDGGQAEGEVVFAGYGHFSPKNNRNDFENIDIKDKIVLIRRGCPDNDYDKWGAESIDSVKCMYCYKQGAKAVLIFVPTNHNINQLVVNTNWIASTEIIKNFPIFMVQENVAKFVLGSTKQTYYRMMNNIDSKNVSFNTGKTAKLKAEVSRLKGKARNVLAILPGTDPKLKNEYVIIGGHMDHVGLDANGEICNGADDNASGVAVTLGIAQAMKKYNFKPKRSIVFACWTGEEMGLLGSQAWCKNPTLDIYKTVVYFNLDMVGLGDGNLNMPGTIYAPEITKFIKENADTITLKKINWRDGGLGGSDHNFFLKKGIPAFAGMTSGDHPDYHRPADDADKIKTDILQFVGDFIYHSTEIVAMNKQNFISQNRFDENASRLIDEKWFAPVVSSNFMDLVDKSKPKSIIVNFSDKLTDNPDQNFLTILKRFEKVEKTSLASDKISLKTSSLDIVSSGRRSNKATIIAGFNIGTIGYNEMYLNVLSKIGFKFGILDESFANYGDSTNRENFIQSANAHQLGLIINSSASNKLQFVLEKSKCPVMVLAKIGDQTDEKVLQIIKDKKHLLVLQINNSNLIEEIVKSIKSYEEKLGRDFVAITCDVNAPMTQGVYKKQLLKLEKELSSEYLDKLNNRNYNLIFLKSLQEYPIRTIWR